MAIIRVGTGATYTGLPCWTKMRLTVPARDLRPDDMIWMDGILSPVKILRITLSAPGQVNVHWIGPNHSPQQYQTYRCAVDERVEVVER